MLKLFLPSNNQKDVKMCSIAQAIVVVKNKLEEIKSLILKRAIIPLSSENTPPLILHSLSERIKEKNEYDCLNHELRCLRFKK